MSPVTSSAEPVGLEALINAQTGGLGLTLLYVIGGLCLLIEGFDAQMIGFVAPAIIEEWKVPAAALAPVFSVGLFGMVLGSLGISPLADRIGRRPVLMVATAFFGLCVLATSQVHTMNELFAARLITGVGLGGIMPNVLALVSEYSPSRNRTAAVIVMATAFTMGAAVGGYSAAAMIPLYGWRSLFLVGGATPLIIAAMMAFLLPESVKFLALKGVAPMRIRRALAKIYPRLAATAGEDAFTSTAPQAMREPVAELFRDGRRWPTILIWIVSFMNLLELYFLSNWLPTLLRNAHLAMKTAVTASTLLQVGGIVGSLVLAVFSRRFRLVGILAVVFVIAAFAITGVGQTIATPGLLLTPIFIAGFCVVGGQPVVNALTANYYPTFIRSTGVGWALGIGRLGSIVGPLLGGLFLQMKWGNGELFLAAAAPALIAGLAVVGLARAGGETPRVAAR